MTPQLANVEMFDDRAHLGPLVRTDVIGRVAANRNSALGASRGIAVAVVIATPFWAILGLGVYYFL